MRGFHRSRVGSVFVSVTVLAAGLLTPTLAASDNSKVGLQFRVTLAPELQTGDLAGRLIVVASTQSGDDQLSTIVDFPDVQPFFGMDVSTWSPGTTRTLRGDDAYGFPLEHLTDLPEGDYYVQAFLNVYTQFTRSDGSVVWLHMPCGDGQDAISSPGNLYSAVVPMHLDGQHAGLKQLTLDQMIPYPEGTSPFAENAPADTCQQGNYTDSQHLNHIKIQSDLLSKFWGKPMYIGANVLLPMTYDQPGHESERYPVVYSQGHWPDGGVLRFSETGTTGFSGYWKDPKTPQFIVITIRHENPYYDDSYAVNSANLGPYGDAITQELIPYIDGHFRTHPERWARPARRASPATGRTPRHRSSS
jgi:hypothetical protein